jgi:hypothetical protein
VSPPRRVTPVDVIGPEGPPVPKVPPVQDGIIGELLFDLLDDGLPLLLLPIRIETRYRLDADPAELRIRILPDQVHIDADTPDPGTAEIELTVEFWKRYVRADAGADRKVAWSHFVDTVGSRRAGYLARLLRPTRRGGRLEFPEVEPRQAHTPARAALLPHRWLAAGWFQDEPLFQVVSEQIPEDLRVGPDPLAPPWTIEQSGLVTDEQTAWMFDYDRAVAVGMAITVPLVGDAAPATDKISTLLVVGVDIRDQSGELAHLLDVQARTQGLAFVPQGTPTNNTATVPSGWTREDRELADLAERELEPVTPVVGDNAGRLAACLGLRDATPLRRVAFGADPERVRSRAMVTALWDVILDTYLSELLDVGDVNGVTAATRNEVRRWATRNLTGGAPFPTIRVGPQPYGVLPVQGTAWMAEPMRVTTRAKVVEPATTADHVQSVVDLLVDEWRTQSSAVTVLDPNDADAVGTEAHLDRIGDILAQQPHPFYIWGWHSTEWDELDDLDQLTSVRRTYENQMARIEGDLHPDNVPEFYIASEYDSATNPAIAGSGPRFDPTESVDQQIALWEHLLDVVPDVLRAAGESSAIAEAEEFITGQLGLLASHEMKQRTLRFLDLNAFEGALGEDNTKVLLADDTWFSWEWRRDSLALVVAPEAEADEGPAHYLLDLLDRFRRRTDTLPPSGMSDAFLAKKPMLYQLLDATLANVPEQFTADVDEALEVLAGVEPEELDWLLREALGLGVHRLDAWRTAIASERLQSMRAQRPHGIQIGAYGWVTELEPRRERGLSEGFVHAPSMAHATTAAMLRAGWHSHGSDDPSSPVAVDVRSERVRTASWLLDGVREGQSLGDLLGYRFERTLHDLGADEDIRTVRELVLDATGDGDATPDSPVDGVVLLDLARDDALSGLSPRAVEALAGIESAFDAVHDVALFEATHQLGLGNLERAAAMLDSIALGTIAPPELRSVRTPRSGRSVEHRVVVLLDVAPDLTGRSDRGWSEGVRDLIAPGLEAWVAALLPAAADVGFLARRADGSSQPEPLTLADLDLSALDAIYLVGDDASTPAPALRTLASARLGGAAPVEIGSDDEAPISLAEFTVLAIELRRAIEGWRVADVRDVRPAHNSGEAGNEDAPALAAAEDLLLAFDRWVDDVHDAIDAGPGQATTDAVLRIARLGISTGLGVEDPDGAAVLHVLAAGRLRLVSGHGVDPVDRRPGLERRLAALLGARVPLLGRFVFEPAEGGETVTFDPALAQPAEVDDWLDASGRVRADVGRLTTAGLLSELLHEAGGLRAVAGQSPLVPGDRWAATGPPADDRGGRLSVVAVTPTGAAPVEGAALCGLVVDQWSERIPARRQTTGLTFQYDAPSNRPPQAWLVAVPAPGEAWGYDLIVSTLLGTLDWARMRTVGRLDRSYWQVTKPTLHVPGVLDGWPLDDGAIG